MAAAAAMMASKRSLFYKKAPQKIFVLGAWGVFNTARSGAKKFFWLLFFQKK
jgi:hypothetical protein